MLSLLCFRRPTLTSSSISGDSLPCPTSQKNILARRARESDQHWTHALTEVRHVRGEDQSENATVTHFDDTMAASVRRTCTPALSHLRKWQTQTVFCAAEQTSDKTQTLLQKVTLRFCLPITKARVSLAGAGTRLQLSGLDSPSRASWRSASKIPSRREKF